MSDRESITVEVPAEIARLYRAASREEKEQIGRQIEEIARSVIVDRKESAIEQLKTTIRRATREAEKNGLTPEILRDILENGGEKNRDRLGRIMDEIGNKARERGLTIEILTEILQDKE